MIFKIPDDSGMIGLFNPNTYKSFVNENWEYNELMSHFKEQTKRKSLFLFPTNQEGEWNVQLSLDKSHNKGISETIGEIEITNNQLCLINYESLTFAAQFSHVKLPENYMSDLCFKLENGIYTCNLIQLINLDEESSEESIHFILEILKK